MNTCWGNDAVAEHSAVNFTFSGRSVSCNGPGDDGPQIVYGIKTRGTGLTTGSSVHISRYDTDETLVQAL